MGQRRRAWARIRCELQRPPRIVAAEERPSRRISSPAMPTDYPEISKGQSLRERADAVLWIKSQMARLGLTYEHLLAAGCFAAPGVASDARSGVIRFRDANGHAWNGVGTLPEWLQRAVNAGQSIEHFRVA
ncbi:hypothetical protein D9M72_270760 [compost metagenome]